MTRPERIQPATSIARHSRVHSSTIVRHFKRLTIRTRVEHEVVGPDMIGRRSWQRAGPTGSGPAPRPASGYLQPCVAPQPVRAVRAHRVPLALQEDPNPPIPVPRVFGRQATHGDQRRGILFG